MSHVWLFVSHVWLTMSHVWIFVSHVWITKIIWENCQLREIYRNILLVKASWWLWIIISHNSKPLKADVDLKWRSYRYQLKWSPEKWLGQESQRNWKCLLNRISFIPSIELKLVHKIGWLFFSDLEDFSNIFYFIS